MSPTRRFAATLLMAACAAQAQTDPADTSAAPAAAGSQATPSTGSEAAPFRAAFERADTDRDGLLTPEEAARFPAMAARFKELDRDGDGRLSPAEFEGGYSAGG